jgi:two-component system chemotaxis sensor kinase CheA
VTDFPVSPELLSIYLEDARLHLEALDHTLLALERDGVDAETVAQALGPLHTLKGNSGMMGFAQIKDYVHGLEDALGRLRDGAAAPGPDLFDALFAGATALRDAVEQAGAAGRETRDLSMELDALRRMAPAPRPAGAAPPAPAPPAPSVPAAARGAAAKPAGRRAEDARPGSPVRSSMVRVDFAQLDNLLNLVGELIIHRTKLEQIGKRLAAAAGRGEAGRELLSAVQQVAGVSAALQETVMDVRMLPIRHVFERFPRMVRDLARQTGKDIELILEGENTRIDKAIIDEIGEPLVHLIRNSVDHGIEGPDARVAAGKTPTGTILLSAAQESNHVVITIMDDGGGIDAVRVREKALAGGLLKGDEALTERDVVQLIFSQGFSTREAVTEVSGRGVGLDVVLKSIERLNGLVEVETVRGVGTKFIIQLPLTLAIIAALLVEAGGRTYAVPLAAVVESVKFGPADVRTVRGGETLRVRERVIPLVRLSALFGLPEAAGGERRYAVILGRGDKRVGMVVDRLRGQQEVVIKGLDETISNAATGLAGATIMGDGRVVLILDVATLFEARRAPALLPAER